MIKIYVDGLQKINNLYDIQAKEIYNKILELVSNSKSYYEVEFIGSFYDLVKIEQKLMNLRIKIYDEEENKISEELLFTGIADDSYEKEKSKIKDTYKILFTVNNNLRETGIYHYDILNELSKICKIDKDNSSDTIDYFNINVDIKKLIGGNYYGRRY